MADSATSYDFSPDFTSLDSGQGGIDWNNLLGGAVKTYGQIEAIKASKPDITPAPSTSPVQVATPQTGIPIQWLLLGAILVGGVFLLNRG